MIYVFAAPKRFELLTPRFVICAAICLIICMLKCAHTEQ